eukprot:4265751-Heterocapsa_arctica.AAC.1
MARQRGEKGGGEEAGVWSAPPPPRLQAVEPPHANETIVSVGPTGVHIQVFERSSGILAITILFLAERL